MKVDIVVDVGNTRMKWGESSLGPILGTASLPHDQPAAWDEQLRLWEASSPLSWAVSSVQPEKAKRFLAWLKKRKDRVLLLNTAQQLPLRIALEQPDHVGIDRLLNAVAAKFRRKEKAAIIVDAGTAVTVDLVDEKGTFQGGAIFPGLRLMAAALHEHTALLPLVRSDKECPAVLGKSTVAAIAAGIHYATAGGINALVRKLSAERPTKPAIYLTGGDARLLEHSIVGRHILWPEMTLQGISLAAEALP